MTRKEIRLAMIQRISDTLEEMVNEIDVADLVTPDHITDFLWEKDFGRDIAQEYIDENEDELVNDLLESIYEDIGSLDLDSPF